MVPHYLLPMTEIAVLFPPIITFTGALIAALIGLPMREAERDDLADFTQKDA